MAKKPGVAKRVVDWVEKTPQAKVLIYSCALLGALAGAYGFVNDTVLVPRDEARRTGRAFDPDLTTRFDGETCTVRNQGQWPAAEVALWFNLRLVDITDCEIQCRIDGAPARPSASAHELLPRETIASDAFNAIAKTDPSASSALMSCAKGHECYWFVECTAQFFHSEDRSRAYFSEEYAVATLGSSGKATIQPVSNFYTTTVSRDGERTLTPDNPKIDHGFQCLMSAKPFLNQQQALLDRAALGGDRSLFWSGCRSTPEK